MANRDPIVQPGRVAAASEPGRNALAGAVDCGPGGLQECDPAAGVGCRKSNRVVNPAAAKRLTQNNSFNGCKQHGRYLRCNLNVH